MAESLTVLPTVAEVDAHWDWKQRAEPARQQTHTRDYTAIEVPKNTPTGFVTAFFAVVTGFALIWHIWWMAALGAISAFATLLVFAFRDQEEIEIELKPELGRVCPGLLGGHEWNGGAYSPRLHALFMPATDWCNHIKPDAEVPNPKGQNKQGQSFGGKFEFEPWDNARRWVSAFDDATGKKLWQYQSAKPVIGSVAATGGDLVFVGELTGDFLAFDAKDGEVLFKRSVGGPAAGGLVSYAAGTKQYVAVVSGFVGGYYHQLAPAIEGGNPTITVFGLKP